MGLVQEFDAFVDSWLVENMTPLDPHSDTTVETWLESTSYPKWRREQLSKTSEQLEERGWKEGYAHVKSFIKDEPYPDWKHCRPINSRSDHAKVRVAPIFRLIEKKLFERPEFIKKVPIKDRPKYIYERVYRLGKKYIETDYTTFEALFSAEIMEACEMKLYKYMSQDLPDGPAWYQQVHDLMTGTNKCHFKNFTANVRAKRMSGEMCTSLGNGFTNLMLMLFVAHKCGAEVTGVVEGDDGLFVVEGEIDVTYFQKLGMDIKLEYHENINEASFCGLIFDPDDLINVTDPLEVLANFGWTSSLYMGCSKKTKRQLIRAKSLSLLAQYPGMPIVQELALYGLRMTEGEKMCDILRRLYKTNMWEREYVLNALDLTRIGEAMPVPRNTRLLVEKKFGVTIEDQLRIEELLRSKNDLSPLNIDAEWPASWVTYANRYVLPLGVPNFVMTRAIGCHDPYDTAA